MDFIFEFLFEIIGDIICNLYVKLFSPNLKNATIKKKIQKVLKTLFAILTLSIFIGILFLTQEDTLLKEIGKYMTIFPLLIIAVQIITCVAVRIKKR